MRLLNFVSLRLVTGYEIEGDTSKVPTLIGKISMEAHSDGQLHTNNQKYLDAMNVSMARHQGTFFHPAIQASQLEHNLKTPCRYALA